MKKYPLETNPHLPKKKNELGYTPVIGPVLDLDSVTYLLGKRELTIEMLKMLVESFSQELGSIQKAHSEQNLSELEYLAHKMKGGACYCGTPRLKQACEQLELYLHRGKDTERVKFLFNQLIHEIEAVESAYHKFVNTQY